jgi:predicted transcriptional regulator of viral defense system
METKYFIEQPYFSRKNLELILGINRRTLDDRIKNLIDKGILLRLKKGFYLSMPYYDRSNNKKELLEYIGSISNYPSYISLEYALDSYNLLAESVNAITYVTLKKTRKISTKLINYSYRNIKDDLFTNFITKSFDNKAYQIATPAKSVFDLFYYMKEVESDILERYVLEDSRINWDNLSNMDKKELVSIINSTGSPKLIKLLNILQKNKLI